MDLDDGLVMGFLVIVLGIPFLYLCMKINDFDTRDSLVWALVSFFTYIELGILAVVLLAIIGATIFQSPKQHSSSTSHIHQQEPEPTPEELELERQEQESVEAERERIKAGYEEAERIREEEQKTKRIEEEKKKQEEERLYLDHKRTRSFDAALESALEDF